MAEGGKATTTPSMAQTLGPLKMDMKVLLNDINEKTSNFKGMQVPVELNINEKDKSYEITVKSPPASELIRNSLKLDKGSGEPEKRKVANISVEQVILIAKMKMEGLFTTNLKASIKTIAGTCNSMGVLIEGNDSKTFNQLLDEGKYDAIINSDKLDVTTEKTDELKNQLSKIQMELDKQFAKKAKAKEAEKPTETKETTEAKPEEKKDASSGDKKEDKSAKK